MATKKTKGPKVKAKAKTARAKSRRKIALNTPGKSKASEKKAPRNSPRKRNALGAARVARITPRTIPEPVEVTKPRPVAISKALYEKIPEDFDAPWVLACRDNPTEEETSHNRGRMLQVILIATLLLGVFNSSALVNWVRSLPVGPVEDRIIMSAEVWHDWMKDLGTDDLIVSVRKYVETLKSADW